jgi:lysyl-tRNA synthetase class 2
MSRQEQMMKSRDDKLQAWVDQGVYPYPQTATRTHTAVQALAEDNLEVSITGRIRAWRGHGKIQFADVYDETGKIQVAFKFDDFAEKEFTNLENFDIGDFIEIQGTTFTTQAGERTVQAKKYQILAKSMLPLPDSWYGLKDVEERYRKRYLDLILNPEVQKTFRMRSKIMSTLRKVLDEHKFLEVETPSLQPLYGGANARPFITHHNALDMDLYLKISDELYLKRLIVGGFEKVYEIDHNFRNEGIDRTHNPEFTMMECYAAYWDYHDMMSLTEEIYQSVAMEVHGTTEIQWGEHTINLKAPWRRLTMKASIKEYLGVDVDELSDEELMAEIKKHGLEYEQDPTTSGVGAGFIRGIAIATLFEAVEPHLIQPTFIIDFPKETTALCKLHRDNPELIERFEPYILGWEIGNAYTELNDPKLQRHFFEEQVKAAESGDEEAHPLDEDFLTAMEYGMPPTGGLGLGIDRMVMIMTGEQSIRDVILFPTMREVGQPGKPKVKMQINQGNKVGVDLAVLEKFPGMFFAQVLIKDVLVKKSNPELEELKEQVLSSRKNLSPEDIATIPAIKTYRELFKATGVDFHKKKPSPEALLKRIISGKGLYNINTAVDAYNLAVVETGVGLGGFDAEKLRLPVVLRFSQSGEKLHLLGDEAPTFTRNGELVYSDQEKLITIDLNYRDISETKLTEKTKNIVLFADGGPGLSQEEVVSALRKGAEYIQQFCGGTIGEIQIFPKESNTSMSSGSGPNQTSLPLPPREESEALLKKYVKNEALLRHSYMVAQAMEHYAKELGEDSELWYQAGLLHDLDWEMYPDEHPNKAVAEIIHNYPQPLKDAILAHGPDRTGKHPETLIERYLFACDELSGLINATSLMRPTRFEGMEAKSVKKKLKDKSFAANVSRNDIDKGFELIGKSPDDHITFLIQVFQKGFQA